VTLSKASTLLISFRFQGLEISKPNIYNEIPTVGYQGFKSTYRTGTVRVNHRKDPFFNLNALRPRIKELDEPEQQQRALSTKKYQQTATSEQQTQDKLGGSAFTSPIRVPIAGYTGHRMGYRSQNFYGKSYRDCSIQSKIIQTLATQN